MNTIEGEIRGGHFLSGEFDLPLPGRAEGRVVLGIRPEHVVFHRTPQPGLVPFTLDVVELVQPDTLLFVKKGKPKPVSLVVRIMKDCSDLKPPDPVYLEFPREALHFFDITSGKRLP